MNHCSIEPIVVNAPAKINWRLSITGKRPDGYHELDMIMQTISLHDTIIIAPSNQIKLTINGISVPAPENNLIIKAIKAIGAYTGKQLCAEFDVQKRIPSQAGLGGGSSDCAYTLLALNQLYGLKLTRTELCAIGLSLGADVPFFLYGGLCRVQGIGERITPLHGVPIANLLLFHVQPGLSTPVVFKKFDKLSDSGMSIDTDLFVSQLIKGNYRSMQPFNALESPASILLPEINDTKRKFLDFGAVYTLMSGSGSAVYAVFNDVESAKSAQRSIPGTIFSQTTASLA